MTDRQESLPFQAHSDTSRHAAHDAKPAAPTQRAAVLRLLSTSNGLTDEEIQKRLEMNPSTERPRRIELVNAGLVRDSGRCAKTTSGRWATVWEVAP